MHETAIDGDRNIELDIFVYYNVEQFKSLTVSYVQTVRTSYLETYMAIFADETMQTIPAAVHAYGDYR